MADICRNVVGTAYPRCDDLHQLYWGRIEEGKKEKKEEKKKKCWHCNWLNGFGGWHVLWFFGWCFPVENCNQGME